MQTRCHACFKWTSLPATQAANVALEILCEHCHADLPKALKSSRYALCRVCAHYYLRDYGLCPICPPPGDAVADSWLTLMLDKPAIETDRMAPRPLSDTYCITLWEDYQREQSGAKDRVQSGSNNTYQRSTAPKAAAATTPAPPPTVILPPDPIALFDMDEFTPSANGTGHENGNGHGADISVKANEGLDGVDYELISDSGRLAEVADLLAREPIIAVDTETDGLDPYSSRLLLLQVSTASRAYIIDCQRLDPIALKPLLESSKTLKLLQNAKFDYKMLKHVAGIELCTIFDTMLAERLLTAGRSREIGLKALASKYAGVVMDKTIRKSFVGVRGDGYLASAQLVYAARDALILFEIYKAQLEELKKWRLDKVDKLENECVAAVGDMELNGLVIDTTHWRAILEKVAVERDRSAIELNDLLATVALQTTMFGVPVINLNSNSQLLEAFGRLGVNLEDTREQTLVKYGEHPAIKKLLDYRGHEKTLSAFGEELLKLINKHTNRMHPDFNQYGADTGRFSCTNPNVQQIPATSDFRSCFVAAEGYKLVTCVAAGTRVATTRGLVPVEQVVVGDSVLQEDSSVRLVQRVIDQGTRPAVKLRTSMGYELIATPEHRLRVLDGAGDYVWQEAGALQAGSAVAIKSDTFSLMAHSYNSFATKTTAVIERVRAEAPEIATELGLHHILDNSLIFDRVVEISAVGTRHVYDLTVEDTSTYITEGFVSHNCDYSQAELRILAELSGDPAFVNAFVSGGDLHAITASQMFQVPLESVSKPQRSAAKSINFGLAYGRGPGSLAIQLGVSPDEARALIDKYFQAYTGVQKWLDKAARESVKKGYSETTLGRKRFYELPSQNDPEYRSKIASIERQGKNTPIQGGNADMTKIALCYLREHLRPYNAKLINTVHDEIVVEVIADQAEEVKHIVERQMVRAGEDILSSVPVVADAGISDYWKK